MNIIKKMDWYSDEQKLILSRSNLNASIILFCSALCYAIVSIIGAINGTRELNMNGINRYNYAFLVFSWSISGLLISLYLRYSNIAKGLSDKSKIIHNNCAMYYNIGFYVVLTHMYMLQADDKVKPLMAYGIIIGVYTLCAYVNPYILSIIYFVIYISTFIYIKNYIGKSESILGGVYVLLYIIFIFVKSWSARNVYQKRKELENLNSDTLTKYIEQLKLNTEFQRKTIIKLADLIESRDGDTGEHTKRTSEIVKLIAEKLYDSGLYTDKLNSEYIEAMSYASMLHDVGKIKISDSILNAPRKLTSEEFDQIKLHTEYGKEIIREILLDKNDTVNKNLAEEIAFCHHEKWDGSGYPQGLTQEEIPLSARIMAVADVYDALISKRCYKESYSVDEAFAIIKDGKGTHFDPVIVNAFLSLKSDIIKESK